MGNVIDKILSWLKDLTMKYGVGFLIVIAIPGGILYLVWDGKVDDLTGIAASVIIVLVYFIFRIVNKSKQNGG